MVIYQKGEHGTRIAYTEEEAKANEKDGYVRYDPREELAAKRAAMRPEPPKRGRKKKKADQ